MSLSMVLPPGINLTLMGDDLLIQQLHEWAQIEDDYDQIPWIIADPGEEEHIFDKLDEAIHRHTAHARAGPETGQYLTRLSSADWVSGRSLVEEDWTWQWFDPKERMAWTAGRLTQLISVGTGFYPAGDWIEDQEDVEGRIVVRGEVKNKGMNYMKATTPYGDCYINLKFTRYVPAVGEPIKMLCRFQDPSKNISMKCIKVL